MRIPSASAWAPVILLAAIPAAYLALDIVGAVRSFSPVPFWDMWHHYIVAHKDLVSGHGFDFFFGQTNEHRIVISKALFAADLIFFGGESRFLIAANIFLMILIWLTFGAIAKRLLRGHGDLWIVVALCLGAPCLSWLHEANITWGYQSQFFLAYLLPLAAFACLARAMEGNDRRWFAAAVIFGVGSLGTMANGIFALPLMAMMLLMVSSERRWLAWLSGVGVVATAAWLFNYAVVPRERPTVADFLTFVVTFFGSPFEHITGDMNASIVAGIVFIGISIVFAVRWFRQREHRDPMVLAVLAFIAYMGATAAMIAWGRAAIGANAVDPSRYATPALIAWCALALLAAHTFKTARHARASYAALGAAVALCLLPQQLKAVGPFPEAEKKTFAGLALKMKIFDAAAISHVYPLDNAGEVYAINEGAEWAAQARLSIFGDATWDRAVSAIGASADGFHVCRGVVDQLEVIPGEQRYRRARGWAFDATIRRVPRFVHFVSGGVIVGVGVTGAPRPDVAKELFGRRALKSGFDGYIAAPEGAQIDVVCAQ